MHKFYPVDKGRFSTCLCKIYAVKVCMILVEMLSVFTPWFLAWGILKEFLLFHIKLYLEKVKKDKLQNIEITHVFIACFKTDKLGSLIEKRFCLMYLMNSTKINLYRRQSVKRWYFVNLVHTY